MRHTHTLMAIVTVLLLCSPVERVHGQASQGTMLQLMPHCTESDRSLCKDYRVRDAVSLQTDEQNIGDILDLDIVLRSDAPGDIESVRSWLRYDPTVLEARSIDLSDAISAPYPGEQNIDAPLGIVKIGGSIRAGISQNVVIARVTFRILGEGKDHEISFHQYRQDGTGSTSVLSKRDAPRTSKDGTLPDPPCINKLLGCQAQKIALLSSEPARLVIPTPHRAVDTPAQQATSTSTPSVDAVGAIPSVTAASPSEAIATSTDTFALLEVQGLRITTRDRDVYVGWLPLRSSEVKSYAIYYGTTPGTYMMRTTVPQSMQSVTIRDMQPGSTVYVAVRAIGANGQESAFSNEVSVVVGRADTSTNPLDTTLERQSERSANLIAERHGTTISGETGVSNWMWMIIGLSLAIGVIASARRNFRHSPHA